MLPRANRIVTGEDLRTVQRRGTRIPSPLFVMTVQRSDTALPSRWGFVVSKKVGNAVVRNRVKRRLRALAQHDVHLHPTGASVVVRALPDVAGASYGELANAWDNAVKRLHP